VRFFRNPSVIYFKTSSNLILIDTCSDIFKVLIDSKSPRLASFVKGLPNDLVHALENDEQEPGQFICEVMDGNVPGIIEYLAEDVWDEIKDDWTAVTDFIESIPTLAPAILEDIIHDGEDVVPIIGDIFTNPKAAVTAIVSGVEVVVSDIETGVEEVLSCIKCLFKKCNNGSTQNPAATISASCKAILAAATTTYSPIATTSNYYPPAQISAYQTAATTIPPPAATTPSTSTTSKSTTIKTTTSSQTSTEIAATAVSSTTWGASLSVGSVVIPALFGLFGCFLVAVAAL
jgi:hypothetical protein